MHATKCARANFLTRVLRHCAASNAAKGRSNMKKSTFNTLLVGGGFLPRCLPMKRAPAAWHLSSHDIDMLPHWIFDIRIVHGGHSVGDGGGDGQALGLSQRHVQRHHDAEAHSEGKRAKVGMLALGHFRNQLLHYHIKHCACGKAQQIRKCRDD